jgi:hypothetical protein
VLRGPTSVVTTFRASFYRDATFRFFFFFLGLPYLSIPWRDQSQHHIKDATSEDYTHRHKECAATGFLFRLASPGSSNLMACRRRRLPATLKGGAPPVPSTSPCPSSSIAFACIFEFSLLSPDVFLARPALSRSMLCSFLTVLFHGTDISNFLFCFVSLRSHPVPSSSLPPNTSGAYQYRIHLDLQERRDSNT